MNGSLASGVVPRGVMAPDAGGRLALAGVWLFALLAIGCNPLGSMNLMGPGSPTSSCDVKGYVWNDGSGFDEPYLMVGGATVTVLDGPNAGKSARSSDQAAFTISDWQSGDALFEVRKDGYDPITERKTVACSTWGGSVLFNIGQPPHILKSWVRIPRTTTSVEAATVEIMDGANAGRVAQTDSKGVFLFTDLQASEPFSIRVSKIGFRTVVIPADRLAKNTTLSIIDLAPE